MTSQSFGILLAFVPLTLAAQSLQERGVPLSNWTPPRQVHRSQLQGAQRAATPTPTPKLQLPGGVTTDILVFVPMTPCRLADTRVASGFPALGSTPLAPLTPRTLAIAGACGVENPGFLFPGPEAFSLNVTVVPPGGNTGGYLLAYPNPISPIPLVASMTWNPGASYQSNAVIAAASPGGSVNVVANATTDVVIDINGYYAAPSDDKGDTALGTGALNSDSTGTGNTAFGYFALVANTTGTQNTAFGNAALSANIGGGSNTAVGFQALNVNNSGISGGNNTAVGSGALATSTSGFTNVAVGSGAMGDSVSASFSVALGFGALFNASGNSNIAIGWTAGGSLTTGGDNIMIDNGGMSSDDHTIRIGADQTSTYIAGILGNSLSSASPVVINSNGQLGVEGVSSRRYKEDIQDMGDASKGLLRLRPVTFHYKKADSDRSKPLEYGLIAEEVAEVYPDLVVRGKDGQVESVQYFKLPAILLNELQKEHRNAEQQARHADEQDRRAQQQDETIKKLEARLAVLEAQLTNATTKVTSDRALPSAAGGR